MRYIDTWLSGLGLDYVIPKLKANGITTPKKLAALSLREIYEVVGVEDSEDRKKLFFLIQRLQTILHPKDGKSEDSASSAPVVEKEVVLEKALIIPSDESQPQQDEDLRLLRVNKRKSLQESGHLRKIGEEAAPLKPEIHSHKPEISRKIGENVVPLKPHIHSHKPEISRKIGEDVVPLKPEIHSHKPEISRNLEREPVSDSRKSVSEAIPLRPEIRNHKPEISKNIEPVADRRKSMFDEITEERHSLSKIELTKKDISPSVAVKEGNSADNINIQDLPIRVVVRKRPLGRSELARGEKDVLEIKRPGHVFVHEPKIKVDLTKVVETQGFAFDDAFDSEDSNEEIYQRTIRPLISFIFEGGKASCFAYGQTGSGKTFTMMGCKPNAPSDVDKNAGLYVLAAREIFSTIRSSKRFAGMKVYVSCFEIYGGKLFDLLNNRKPVKCLEDAKQRVQVPGLTEHFVGGVEDLLDKMSTAHTQRSVGCTGANAESSRSHQILQIVVKAEKGGNQERKLSFIDLAGSERGADTNHSSKQTRMEGAEINTSLLALKEVIRSLEKKHGHTPFRGSKLTQVLKDSFIGERTRTCMIACVSPSHTNCEHTLNTLRYADRVKEHQIGQSDSNSILCKVEHDVQQSISPRPDDSLPENFGVEEIKKNKENHSQNLESYGQHFPGMNGKVSKTKAKTDLPAESLEIKRNSELIQKTVGLLSAHKLSIAEMVEVMKEEMDLVQDMENVDDRNTDSYVEKLDKIIRVKSEAISSLRKELSSFRNFRSQG